MSRARNAVALIAAAALAASSPRSHADGGWILETAATGVLGASTSLALDAAGAPRIAFNYGAQPQLARRDAGGWTIESLVTPPGPAADGVDRSGEVSGAQLIYFVVPSLAIDPVSALPRVAYGKSPEEDVWFAERTGTGWTYERLSQTGESPSLALDGQGRPHVIFYDHFAGLQYAVRDGATWTVEPVGGGIYGQALRLDAQGRPHVALSLATPNSDLLLASRELEGWSVESADTAGNVGHEASLVLDAAGTPHVSYFDATAHALRYATRSGDAWMVETVAAQLGDWCPSSIALDPMGRPFVAFYDTGPADLRFARREGGVWSAEVVESAGDVGDFCSLAIDGQGRPHIGYFDASGHQVRYATMSAVVAAHPLPEPAGSGLARLSPNPLRAGQALDLVLRLEAPRAIALELLDPAGRRVATREPETFPSGVHGLRWDPAIHRAGLYFLRVRSDRDDRFGARLVILR